MFLSYSRTDRAYVDRLAAHLEAEGIPVWYDYDLVASDRWDEVIRDQVGTCAAFVVVMTPAAEASAWVKREINHAEKTGRPIYPLLLSGDAFFRLSDLHFEAIVSDRLPSQAFVAHLAARTGPIPRQTTPMPLPQLELRPDTLVGHTGAVTRLAWSPDGRRLATTSDDKTARIWDPTTGKTLRTLTGHTDAVWQLAWSPDGHHLATACRANTARIWDIEPSARP